MKIILLVCVLFIGFALSQDTANATKPVKPATNRTIKVLTCGNLTRYAPHMCCPSFPKIESKEIVKCASNCAQQAPSSLECCITNCSLTLIKAVKADGSFNETAIGNFVAKMSNIKNKTDYIKFSTRVAKDCIESVAANQTGCPANNLVRCVARQLFTQCPDKKNASTCRAVFNATSNCTDYPISGASAQLDRIRKKVELKLNSTTTVKPTNGSKAVKQEKSKNGTATNGHIKNKNGTANNTDGTKNGTATNGHIKNKNGTANNTDGTKNGTATNGHIKNKNGTANNTGGTKNGTATNGQIKNKNGTRTEKNNSTINKNGSPDKARSTTLATNVTSDNISQPPKVQAIKGGKTEKATTHASQSGGGVLGNNGPGFSV